jgi:hypothetical protein
MFHVFRAYTRWLFEIGAAFEVTFDPIFGEQGSTIELPLTLCIVLFVSMPQIRGLKRSRFNARPLPALGLLASRKLG